MIKEKNLLLGNNDRVLESNLLLVHALPLACCLNRSKSYVLFNGHIMIIYHNSILYAIDIYLLLAVLLKQALDVLLRVLQVFPKNKTLRGKVVPFVTTMAKRSGYYNSVMLPPAVVLESCLGVRFASIQVISFLHRMIETLGSAMFPFLPTAFQQLLVESEVHATLEPVTCGHCNTKFLSSDVDVSCGKSTIERGVV